MTLSDRQVAQYFDDGFLIVEDLFTARDLLPVMDEIAEAVDDLVERLHAAGRIVERHAEKDLFTRLAAVEKDHPDACVILFKEALMGMRLAELWASKKLLDIVACFIGPDVDGHPIWTLRPKTPVTQLMSVPWHQDDAYFTPGSEETFKVGAWIPFLDVDTHNGCMQVVRGGHKTRPHTLPHHLDSEARDPRSWYVYIDQSDLPPGEVVTCEMEFGSALFINDFTPHRSLENTSDQVRWTVDLRWQRPGLPTGGDATVPMRRAGDPRFRPALAAWIERNRRNREAYGIDMGETPFEVAATTTAHFVKRWAKSDRARRGARGAMNRDRLRTSPYSSPTRSRIRMGLLVFLLRRRELIDDLMLSAMSMWYAFPERPTGRYRA